ncbi:hypothetical protein DFH06DRAFT_1344952 [Mycena polygramma]|nr:hypothetical protein DFH06DRAFT_1344952 [Mycena polygramma]
MCMVDLILFTALAAFNGALAVPLVPLSPTLDIRIKCRDSNATTFVRAVSTETDSEVQTVINTGLSAATIYTTTDTVCPGGSADCLAGVATVLVIPATLTVASSTIYSAETETVLEWGTTIHTLTQTDCPGLKRLDCVVKVNTVVLLPVTTTDPEVSPLATLTRSFPSGISSTFTSVLTPANKPTSTAPSSTASVGDFSHTMGATSRNRTQIILGGILGGLSLLGIMVAIIFMLRRRRLQTTKPGFQPDFRSMFSVEATHPEFEGFVSNTTSQSTSPPASTVDHGMFEKALVWRANLQQQVHQIEGEIAELQRITTRFRVANPSGMNTEAAGDNVHAEGTANMQIAALRARVQELEDERDATEAPPGYFDQ